MALAEATHRTGPQGQTTAIARGEERDEFNFATGLTTPPSEAAGTMHFRLDDDGDMLAAGLTPLAEVRPQMGHERHSGCGFELLLDVTAPPMGGELVEVPNVMSQVVEQNVDIPVHGGMEYISPEPAVFPSPAPVVEYLAPATAVSPPLAPVVECIAPASVGYAAPAPVVDYIAPVPAVHAALAPVIEYITPAPARYAAPTPIEERISPAPAGFLLPVPVVEYIAPVPVVSPSPAPVVDLITPVLDVFHTPAPVEEYSSPVPAVFHAPVLLEEFLSPEPAVSRSPAPVVEHLSPAPAVLPRGDDVTLLFRKSTECRPRLRVYARRTRPLRSAFEAHCRRFGLQESQVRFSCDVLLSPDHSPGQLGLEDGDVIEAEEVYEEDEEQEEEEDEGTDEIDGDRSLLVSRVRAHLVLCSPRCRQAC